MHHFDYDKISERRSKYIPYDKVERFMDLHDEDILLDIGSGDGFYSVNFARLLNRGKVFALEVDRRGYDLLAERMQKENITNVYILFQDACDEFDLSGYTKVFFSNTFHDLPCRNELIDRLLKGGSARLEIILIEYRKDTLETGPPEGIKISEEEMREIFEGKGFRLIDSVRLEHNYLHRYLRESC